MTHTSEPHLSADVAVSLQDDRPGTLARAIGCVVVQEQEVAIVPGG